MRVAVLFERSGVVRSAFASRGHTVVSCDLRPAQDNGPGAHIVDDVTRRIWYGYDLIIAHPPCTAIEVSGNRYYAGTQARQQAIDLIKWVWNLPSERLVIENPVGQINTYLPDLPRPQYIQPWQFGHPESKKTGLWKRNLPDLKPTHVLDKPASGYWNNQTPSGQNRLGPSPDRADRRSRTYEGIAQAMAEQWGKPHTGTSVWV